MPLVNSLPFHYRIVNAPPTRLETADLNVPENVELTYVGVAHDARFSSLDFLEASLAAAHVFAYEANEWAPQDHIRYNRLANGYPKAKQELEKRLAAMAERERFTGTRQALWDRMVVDALYQSGVRVFFPDYPAGHEAIKRTDRSTLSIQASCESGQGPQVSDLQNWAEHDRFIAQAVCDGIHKLRREDKKTAARHPLSVLMLFGVNHMAVPDVLQTTAQKLGVESFIARSFFESNDIYRASTVNGTVAYQNWLRVPAG